VAVESRSQLEELLDIDPPGLRPKLGVRELSRLARTCRGLRDLFNEALLMAKAAHYVIVDPTHENKNKVIAMQDADPALIDTVINQVISNTGLIIEKKTLFQLAYGAGDDDYCQAMIPAFVKHCGSEEAATKEMERQRNEILESEEEHNKKEGENSAHLQLLLQPVIAAISVEQFNHGRDANKKLLLSLATLAAIDTFRDKLKNWMLNIEKGLHFRYNTLQEVYNSYAVIAALWHYQYTKCALFEDGVLSSMLTYLPVNDGQKFSQGLYYLQEKNEPFRRSLALRDGGKNFYDALREPSSDFAISGSSIDIIFGVARGVGGAWAVVQYGAARYKKYVEQKYQTCRAYAASRATTEEVSACNLVK
jgi:hypothetical protein